MTSAAAGQLDGDALIVGTAMAQGRGAWLLWWGLHLPPPWDGPSRLLNVLFCHQRLQLQGSCFPAGQPGDNYHLGCAGRARCGWIWCASPARAGGLPPYHLLSHLLRLGEKQQMLSRWARLSLHATISPLILPAPLVSQKRKHLQEKAQICVSRSPAPVPCPLTASWPPFKARLALPQLQDTKVPWGTCLPAGLGPPSCVFHGICTNLSEWGGEEVVKNLP